LVDCVLESTPSTISWERFIGTPCLLGGEFGHAILEALALVAEGELGAFAPERPGDAVGDRPVRKDAGDEEALAGEKSHGRGACARGGADDSGMQNGPPWRS